MSSCYLRAIGENFATSSSFTRRAVHLDFGSNLNDGYGIPYSLTTSSAPQVPITFGSDGCDYSDESDAGPYRIAPTATIEGSTGAQGNVPPTCTDCDRHLISLDTTNCILYETYFTKFVNGKNSSAGLQTCSAAKFDLTRKLPSRTLTWTSADAAGMPLFPGLAKYDEAISSSGITHAIRFTVLRAQKAYMGSASHVGPNKNATYLPYGARLRLKSTFDVTKYTDPAARGLVTALKTYGVIFADQGSNMYISGTSDSRWATAIGQINSQFKIYHDDFEVVQTGTITRGWTTSSPVCNGVTQNSNWSPPAVGSCP